MHEVQQLPIIFMFNRVTRYCFWVPKCCEPPDAPVPGECVEFQDDQLLTILLYVSADNFVSCKRIISANKESSCCLTRCHLSEALMPLTFQVRIFIEVKENTLFSSTSMKILT